MDVRLPRIVGDVRCNHPSNKEYFETILRLLEEFMVEHKIEKIDVGWSREGVLATREMKDEQCP